MKYELNANLMNGLVNYLVSRPYAEVVQLLNAIQQVKGIPEAGDQVTPPQLAPETPPTPQIAESTTPKASKKAKAVDTASNA